MKTILVMTALVLSMSNPSSQDRDLDAVMKVVQKENVVEAPQVGKKSVKATRIRLAIRDEDGETFSLSLPLSWVEWLLSVGEDVVLDELGGHSQASLEDVMKRVRELGPSELLEIRDGRETIRIWLE